jgi:hypothetical protein
MRSVFLKVLQSCVILSTLILSGPIRIFAGEEPPLPLPGFEAKNINDIVNPVTALDSEADNALQPTRLDVLKSSGFFQGPRSRHGRCPGTGGQQ